MPENDRKHLLNRRRELRTNASIAERVLWNKIRRKGLGFKFRRQHPLAGYFVDFYCHEAKVVVEVDGVQHGSESAVDHDKKRDATLMRIGNVVLHFPAWVVCRNIDGVCLEIRKCCEVRSGKTPP